ncbi:hypothetical protein PG984_001492 [Apiospora sp. TS-2023a]
MEGDQKKRPEYRTTISAFLEGGSLPTSKYTTRSTLDGESQDRQRHSVPVPVPEVVAAWKEGQVAITITERARGRTLAELWDGLGREEREVYAREVGG